MKSNIQTQIPIPLQVGDFQKPIRAIVKIKICNGWTSIKECEKKIGITGLDKWLRGERNYSLEKIIMILEHFKISFGFTVGGKSYELYKKKEKTHDWLTL